MRSMLRAGQLIVSPDESPIPGGVVVWEDDRIVAVGDEESLRADVDHVIDRSESTVLPGLIDSHAHITTNTVTGNSLADQSRADPVEATLAGVLNLGADIRTGVTTMRVLGDPAGMDVTFKRAIEQRRIIGPTLLTTARAFRPSHGTAAFAATTVDGEAALRTHIRENFFMGADWIKLFVTNVMHGQQYEDYLRGDLTCVPAYTKAEIAAAVDEAHTLGMRVATHAIGGDAMRWAMEVGVDSVEHGNLLEEGDIEYFLRYGTTLSDPNLQLFFDDETGFRAKPNWSNDWWQAKVIDATERTREYIAELLHRGVNICLAVDSNHSFLWKELVHFVGIGATPAEALLAVTRNPARLFGLENEIGAIRAGMRADLIAVDGDPLQDIEAIRNISLVIARGREVQLDEESAIAGLVAG